MKSSVLSLIILSLIIQNIVCQDPNYEKYCIEKGGVISKKTAGYDTRIGYVDGNVLNFCQIEYQGNIGMIGLETLGSTKPSLVSTYIKSLIIDPTKKIKGPFVQAAMNLCYALGGASINFNMNGGWYDELGYVGICFFGDGSHIADWTLLYAGLGFRVDVRDATKGEVLNINIPSIYE